jgi:hypothetical protein
MGNCCTSDTTSGDISTKRPKRNGKQG